MKKRYIILSAVCLLASTNMANAKKQISDEDLGKKIFSDTFIGVIAAANFVKELGTNRMPCDNYRSQDGFLDYYIDVGNARSKAIGKRNAHIAYCVRYSYYVLGNDPNASIGPYTIDLKSCLINQENIDLFSRNKMCKRNRLNN